MAWTTVLLVVSVCLVSAARAGKVVCFLDGRSYWREGVARVTAEELKPALQYCTHLVYGFAGLDEDDYKLEPLDKNTALEKGKGQYKAITALKRGQPGLTVLLSVGGYADQENIEKYLEILEEPNRRTDFANSVRTLINEHGFDGIDLAWEFPQVKEKKERSTLGSIWHKIKKTFGSGIDSNEAAHRQQFADLVRELKSILRPEGHIVTLSALPHINISAYYDVNRLMPHVDHVNLWTYDLRTPMRSPLQADHAAPLFYVYDRVPEQNVDAVTRHWLEHGAEASKLIVGIPTFGRSWKTTKESGLSGAPPLIADGPGPAGTHTKTEGILSYYEICTQTANPQNPREPANSLRRVTDPSNRLGTYAYRLPKRNSGEEEGFWISYEEPETAGLKADYAKKKALGGVALFELSMDDFRGACDGTKFPITRAAKLRS